MLQAVFKLYFSLRFFLVFFLYWYLFKKFGLCLCWLKMCKLQLIYVYFSQTLVNRAKCLSHFNPNFFVHWESVFPWLSNFISSNFDPISSRNFLTNITHLFSGLELMKVTKELLFILIALLPLSTSVVAKQRKTECLRRRNILKHFHATFPCRRKEKRNRNLSCEFRTVILRNLKLFKINQPSYYRWYFLTGLGADSKPITNESLRPIPLEELRIGYA